MRSFQFNDVHHTFEPDFSFAAVLVNDAVHGDFNFQPSGCTYGCRLPVENVIVTMIYASAVSSAAQFLPYGIFDGPSLGDFEVFYPVFPSEIEVHG